MFSNDVCRRSSLISKISNACSALRSVIGWLRDGEENISHWVSERLFFDRNGVVRISDGKRSGSRSGQQTPGRTSFECFPGPGPTRSSLQVDEVVGIMRSNIDKVMERDGRLSELDSRAENLHHASVNFAQTGTRLRKKMWWENMKMKLILLAILCTVITIIIVVIVVETKGDSGSDDGGETTTTTKPWSLVIETSK